MIGFDKVAEADSNGRHVAVYELRRDQEVPQITGEDGAVVAVAKTTRVPQIPEVLDATIFQKALKEFPKGVLAISASVDAGVQVRVEARPAAPCPKCHQPVEGGWAFCPKCGAPQDVPPEEEKA